MSSRGPSSWSLACLLRHTDGMRPDKWAYVPASSIRAILGTKYTDDVLLEMCKTDPKGRFGIRRDMDENLRVRANQGHSLGYLSGNDHLTPMTTPEPDARYYHGTYESALPNIEEKGLSRRRRQHIHIAKEGGVSGARKDCEVRIYINIGRVIAAGIPVYQSENGVVLTSGVDGVLSPVYFDSIETV